jgi:hypothetical protein
MSSNKTTPYGDIKPLLPAAAGPAARSASLPNGRAARIQRPLLSKRNFAVSGNTIEHLDSDIYQDSVAHCRSVSSFLPRHLGRADALQCQAQSDAFVDDASQFLGKRDARVLRGERW